MFFVCLHIKWSRLITIRKPDIPKPDINHLKLDFQNVWFFNVSGFQLVGFRIPNVTLTRVVHWSAIQLLQFTLALILFI